MSEMTNLAVETAIKQKKVVLLDFTKAHPCQDYYDYYYERKQPDPKRKKSLSIWEIDLSEINDKTLLKRLVDFLWYSLNPDRRTPLCYHQKTVIQLSRVLQVVPKSVLSSYTDFLEYTDDAHKERFEKHVQVINRRFHRFCIDEDYKKNPYESDCWDLDKMNLAPERLNESLHYKHLYFHKIENDVNKDLVKKYIKYLLTNTDNSVSTIIAKLGIVTKLLNYTKKPYPEWMASDAEQFAESLKRSSNNKKSIARSVIYMEDFTEYLLLHDLINDSPIKQYHDLTNSGAYQYKTTAPDKYVLTQIFNALGGFQRKYLVIWFLAIYCTGMRISEACQLKKDCLERSDENYFIKFYQPKMKKYVTNIIPKSLYKMIDDYRKTVGADTVYLFPGQRRKHPIQRTTIYEHMKDELEKFKIKNNDGSEYHFTPHSFRHLMAVRMRDEEIPFQYIVEQLHHESPEMTLAYVEYLDKQKIKKMKRFIDIHGNESPITVDVKTNDDVEYAEYLRKFINAQMLPNGVCARPVKLGRCQHCNACLHCKDFRTSVEFIGVHQDQLTRLKKYMVIAKQNKWDIQYQEAKTVSETLERIVNALGKEVAYG